MPILAHGKYLNRICSVESFTLYLWAYNEKHSLSPKQCVLCLWVIWPGYVFHLYQILLGFMNTNANFSYIITFPFFSSLLSVLTQSDLIFNKFAMQVYKSFISTMNCTLKGRTLQYKNLFFLIWKHLKECFLLFPSRSPPTAA